MATDVLVYNSIKTSSFEQLMEKFTSLNIGEKLDDYYQYCYINFAKENYPKKFQNTITWFFAHTVENWRAEAECIKHIILMFDLESKVIDDYFSCLEKNCSIDSSFFWDLYKSDGEKVTEKTMEFLPKFLENNFENMGIQELVEFVNFFADEMYLVEEIIREKIDIVLEKYLESDNENWFKELLDAFEVIDSETQIEEKIQYTILRHKDFSNNMVANMLSREKRNKIY